ncbi:MAG: hypothetical protein ABH822_02475 [Patescibacteria group bacterium]
MKQFIKNLQNADKETRKRWLIILTSSSALAVIALWGVYLNFTLASVDSLTGDMVQNNPGFFQIFSKGFSTIGGKTATGLANSYVYFSGKAGEENAFVIDRGSHRFVYQELEPLPIRDLP